MSETMSEKKIDKRPQKLVLPPTDLLMADHSRIVWRVNTAPGISLQDTLNPSFWDHHFQKMIPGHMIEVLAQDMAWYGVLLIKSVEGREVRVWPVHYTPLSATAEHGEVDESVIEDAIAALPKDQKYIVKHLIGKGYMVRVDEHESEWLGEPHKTKGAAHRWIEEHKKALRR